jgi:hypothetical protein
LRTADGIETALPAVTVAANDIAALDVGKVIASAAPQLAGGYGSVVFRYTAPVSRALYAAEMVQLPGTPIEFHLDAFPQAPKPMTGGREGIWWLPRDSTKDWLVLANTSDSSLTAKLTFYESSGKAWRQPLRLGPRQTARLSVRSLIQQRGLEGSFGGISVDAGARAADLDSAHFVYDDATGFLALMKMFDHNPSATPSERSLTNRQWTIRAPMLPLANPDPALALPAGTTLKPAIFLRNASANTYTAQITFNWRSESITGKSVIPIPLKSSVTTVVDVGALQANGTIPASAQWAWVSITAPVRPDDLLAVATSFDATGRLGAQTPFSDQAANHWEGGMWEVDTNHDTLIAVGNAGPSALKAQVTLYYNSGKDKYYLERALDRDEQLWVDLNKVIRDQIPDKNGTRISPDVMSGTYELDSLGDEKSDGLFEGKLVVDKTYGYAVHGCGDCCPHEFDQRYLVQDPLDLAVNGKSNPNQTAWGIDACTGKAVLLQPSSWNTGDQNVATVDSNGLVTAKGAGSTTDTAYVKNMVPNSKGYCTYYTVPAIGTVNVANVLVPTSLSIVAGTSKTTTEASCSAGQYGTGCGMGRSFTYQVNDQFGSPMRVAGLAVWDEINTTSPNNLNISGYQTTCAPPNTGPCGAVTDTNGQFQENPGLTVCSTVCRVNNACVHGGPTNATQKVHVGSAIITQSLSYYCDHVTVNGQ